MNVNDDIVEEVRANGMPRAYSYGFTLYYEQINGLDSSMRINSGTFVAFQYKRPFKSAKSTEFWFHFNNNRRKDQHNLVFTTAQLTAHPTIFYALPAFEDLQDFESVSPDFVQRAYFIDPLVIGPINDFRWHSFVIDVSTGNFAVHSDVLKKGRAMTWKELQKKLLIGRIGTKIEVFKGHLKEGDLLDRKDIVIDFSQNEKRQTSFKGFITP